MVIRVIIPIMSYTEMAEKVIFGSRKYALWRFICQEADAV